MQQRQIKELSTSLVDAKARAKEALEPIADIGEYLKSFGVNISVPDISETIDLTGEGETMIIADAVKDASAAELRALEELVGFTKDTANGVDRMADAMKSLSSLQQNAAMSAVMGLASGNLAGVGSAIGSGLGASAGTAVAASFGGVDAGMAQQLGAGLGGILGGALGESMQGLLDGIAAVGEELDIFGPLLRAAGILLKQLEPILMTIGDVANLLAEALLYLSPIVRILAEAINLVIAPIGGLSVMLVEVMHKALVPFAHYMSQAINGIVNFVNVIIGWVNNTFGTNMDLIEGIDSVAFLGEASEEAGKQLKESFTNEMANLPPGFKVSSAMFAATSPIADPRGGGMGGMNIGVINVQTTRDLASELDSLRQRTISGSSGIVQGRNSIQDRRN
jgi:hypothetical protein